MGSSGAAEIAKVAEGSETTIEIKIKTLDSRTYTLRVDKQVSVPALKDQIASLTGVISEQQRLICRGRVLKDDQLLSAYHVEDGHTLHMVVGRPAPPSADGSQNQPAASPTSGANRGRSRSIVIEAVNVADQGDGVPPEIGRIVSAVLGSFGFSNFGSGRDGEHVLQRQGASGDVDSNQSQPEQTVRNQADGLHGVFGSPDSVSMGSLSPPVIHDSLSTLSQYLSRLRRELDGNNSQAAASMNRTEGESNSVGTGAGGLPTPGALAEVMHSAGQMLIGQAGDRLLLLARQLQEQANVTDTSVRTNTQTNAWRTGDQLVNLGAFLLELGRTTMTLRLGQTPSEAVVNAGPAVFISPSGPNPLMVQPLPFQSGASFSAVPMGTAQPNSGSVNGLGSGFLPRRIDIQIRRGSSGTNENREERNDSQQPSGQSNPTTENPSNQTAPGVRVVPLRTMVAGIAAPLNNNSSATNPMGFIPLVGRFQQHVASTGQVNGERGSGVQTEPQPAPAYAQNGGNSATATDGSSQDSRPNGRGVNINILLSRNNQESSETQIPSSALQFLSSLFPGGEIQVEGVTNMSGSNVPEPPVSTPTPSAPAEAQQQPPTEEEIVFANLLRQIMPVISQHVATGETQSTDNQAENSEAGTSRRPSDNETNSPNPKRRKTE